MKKVVLLFYVFHILFGVIIINGLFKGWIVFPIVYCFLFLSFMICNQTFKDLK